MERKGRVARRVLIVGLFSLVVAAVALLALARRPAIAPIEPPARSAFAADVVERGRQLAEVGNCASCHTVANGRPFAGGVPLATPFGTIHGTNITPERDAGIGAWSEAAFVRAMREGVGRDGGHLYPAFPYDHFTHTTDADLHALYAYVMTRDPVATPNLANAVRFPFNIRPLVAGWNALFLDHAAVRVDGSQTAEWNRGAYLVQSLGHCGGCHAARNAFGAEQHGRGLAGGEAEGWYVPALNGASPSPRPWTLEQLTAYLRTGIADDHAMAGGPMQGVVWHLSRASEADVRAIAVYIQSSLGPSTAEREARAQGSAKRAEQPLAANADGAAPVAKHPTTVSATTATAMTTMPMDSTPTNASSTAAPSSAPPQADRAIASGQPSDALGASVYADACARCHDLGRTLSSNGALRLPLAIALYDPDPRSLLRIIRDGIVPADGEPGRWMPAFGGTLTDEQLTALLGYLRHTGAEAPAWPDLPKTVRESRATR